MKDAAGNDITCRTCPYFVPTSGYPSEGTCRRHCPIALVHHGVIGAFPLIGSSEWCGDHPRLANIEEAVMYGSICNMREARRLAREYCTPESPKEPDDVDRG